MSSDRPNNDMGSYNIKTKESNKPLDYMFMINAHENCTTCGDQPNVSVHLDRVNLENDLFGLNRKLSRDPKEKYQFDPTIAKTLNYNPPYLCERYITDPSFINPTNKNSYIEDLKKFSIKDIGSIENFNNNLIETFEKAAREKAAREKAAREKAALKKAAPKPSAKPIVRVTVICKDYIDNINSLINRYNNHFKKYKLETKNSGLQIKLTTNMNNLLECIRCMIKYIDMNKSNLYSFIPDKYQMGQFGYIRNEFVEINKLLLEKPKDTELSVEDILKENLIITTKDGCSNNDNNLVAGTCMLSHPELDTPIAAENFESGYVSPNMLFELLVDYALNHNAESTTNLTNALNSPSINNTINNTMNNDDIKNLLSKLKQGLPQEKIDTLTGLSKEQKTQLLTGLTQDQINVLINFLSKFAKTTNNINEQTGITLFIKYLSNL